MIIHELDDANEEYQYKNGFVEKGCLSLYLKLIYDDKAKDNKKVSDDEKEFVGKVYDAVLSRKDKHLVQRMIADLLGDEYNLFYVYFNAFLKEDEITYSELAKCIMGYLDVAYEYKDNITFFDCSYEDIRSKLQRFQANTRKPTNKELVKLVCSYFCVSESVMYDGKGKQYYIDLEHLKEIVDANGYSVDEFLQEHFEMNLCEYDDVEEKNKIEDGFKKYIHRSAETFASICEQQLNIDIDEILCEEDIWIELDEFPVVELYELLNRKARKVVFDTLYNLCLV